MRLWSRRLAQQTNWLRLTWMPPSLRSVHAGLLPRVGTSRARRLLMRSPKRPRRHALRRDRASSCSLLRCAALALTLSGCSTLPSADRPAIVRQPPAAAMVPCQAPSPLTDDSLGALARKLLETAQSFWECESRRAELADFIKRGMVPQAKGD